MPPKKLKATDEGIKNYTTALLTAMFTFKGGSGKTTLTIMLATMLAKMGFTCFIIDANRQCNCTSFFGENPLRPGESGWTPPGGKKRSRDGEGEDGESGDEEDGGMASNIMGRQAERSGLNKTIIARQPTGHPRPLAVVGDKLPAASRMRPMTSEYLIAQKQGDAELDFAVLLESCDIIQPTIAPDMFSWSCSTQMLTCVLPQWLKHWAWVDKLCKGKQTGLMSTFRLNRFPHIMPFMAMHYDIKISRRGHFVRWADANFVSAVSKTCKDLALFIKGGIDGVGLSPAEEELMDADHRLHWRKYIQREMDTDLTEQDGKFVLDPIKKVLANFMIEDMPPVVPLLRHLKYMSVCHEIGKAIFDADHTSLLEYYFEPELKLTEEQETLVEQHWGKVKKETKYVEKQLHSLALSYESLLKQHNSLQGGAAGPSGGRGAGPWGGQGAGPSGAGAVGPSGGGAVGGPSRAGAAGPSRTGAAGPSGEGAAKPSSVHSSRRKMGNPQRG
ncbi:hypothetical protein FOA52_007792 [Chlamydomonas sp. UWO 241]|nr:hypothetical protein FOA52_007792 [Chlamydomonas sp. UWO 241]